jgi:portal protein
MSIKDIKSNTSLFQKLTQAVRYSFGDNSGWFSPQTPIRGEAPETAGRALDYRPGYNIDIRPRRESGITFEQLRRMADGYDLLKLVIETRKDQVGAFDWDIVPEEELDKGAKPPPDVQANIDKAKEFFKSPDGRLTWHTWLRKVLDDSFVLDANVFWPVYKGNQLLRLESVDPATVMKFIDESGRTPVPPLPAYRQVLHGVPTSDYTDDELFYFIRNPRSNTIYGNSPVEQIIMTVNIGLRRELTQLEYFTKGNIPEAIAGVPETWTPDQIASFQTAWNAMFEGDTAAKHQMMFVPNDATKVLQLKDSEALLKGEFDEWLIRIICYAFSVSPTPFVKQMNRATAQSASDTAKEEGLQPLLDYLKDMFDQIIKDALRMDGIKFMWNMEEEQDPQTQSTIDTAYIEHGVWSIDEVRERMGMSKLGVGNMVWVQGKGPIPVERLGELADMALTPPPPPVMPGQAGDGPPKPGQPKQLTGPQKPTPPKQLTAGSVKLPAPQAKKGGGSSGSGSFRKSARYANPTGTSYRSSRQYIVKQVTRDVTEDRT